MKNWVGKQLKLILLALLLVGGLACTPQLETQGKLFIIGGGERSEALIERMMETAEMEAEDYVFVLPMASSIPDTTTNYISDQILAVGDYVIKAHNFTREEAENEKELTEEVSRARLIYIPGGDQNRFMAAVLNTPLYEAIHRAYQNGATIAGTSAGAAVMSEVMLTGEQKLDKTKGGVQVIWKDNIATSVGLGFLQTDIIDQHFIKRSRFNRLISVLMDHPDKQAIGIDESTAIICVGNQAEVVGEGQVVVLSGPEETMEKTDPLISFKNLRFSLLREGDQFDLFSRN